MEYVQGGSLYDYIRKAEEKGISRLPFSSECEEIPTKMKSVGRSAKGEVSGGGFSFLC